MYGKVFSFIRCIYDIEVKDDSVEVYPRHGVKKAANKVTLTCYLKKK